MARKVASFLYRQRYLTVGAVVVYLVTLMTGAFYAAVIGYTCGVGILTAASRFIA